MIHSNKIYRAYCDCDGCSEKYERETRIIIGGEEEFENILRGLGWSVEGKQSICPKHQQGYEVQPNANGFKTRKRDVLSWVALVFSLIAFVTAILCSL